MSHERILVSALYYYSSSPHIEDLGLSFRTERESIEDYKDIGSIKTIEGRAIIFSNQYQHKVALLSNLSETEIAHRKILCFFGK